MGKTFTGIWKICSILTATIRLMQQYLDVHIIHLQENRFKEY